MSKTNGKDEGTPIGDLMKGLDNMDFEGIMKAVKRVSADSDLDINELIARVKAANTLGKKFKVESVNTELDFLELYALCTQDLTVDMLDTLSCMCQMSTHSTEQLCKMFSTVLMRRDDCEKGVMNVLRFTNPEEASHAILSEEEPGVIRGVFSGDGIDDFLNDIATGKAKLKSEDVTKSD